MITVYEPDSEPRVRRVRLPSRPPFTYVLDPLVPLWPERVDAWFGFNNLACARGLLARRLGRADKVVYWAVDFVPNRFGDNALTRAYDRFDALCCRSADARFELSEAALRGRNERLGLRPDQAARSHVVPIGAWVDRVPVTAEDGWKARRVLYVGHLIRRQGVGLLVEALDLLARRGVDFVAEIAGSGPLEQELREHAARAGLDGRLSLRRVHRRPAWRRVVPGGRKRGRRGLRSHRQRPHPARRPFEAEGLSRRRAADRDDRSAPQRARAGRARGGRADPLRRRRARRCDRARPHATASAGSSGGGPRSTTRRASTGEPCWSSRSTSWASQPESRLRPSRR